MGHQSLRERCIENSTCNRAVSQAAKHLIQHHLWCAWRADIGIHGHVCQAASHCLQTEGNEHFHQANECIQALGACARMCISRRHKPFCKVDVGTWKRECRTCFRTFIQNNRTGTRLQTCRVGTWKAKGPSTKSKVPTMKPGSVKANLSSSVEFKPLPDSSCCMPTVSCDTSSSVTCWLDGMCAFCLHAAMAASMPPRSSTNLHYEPRNGKLQAARNVHANISHQAPC